MNGHSSLRRTHLLAFSATIAVFAVPTAALDVTMALRVEGGAQPVAVGTTNLPDGADLMVDVTAKGRGRGSYHGQSKAEVAGGKFRAGPFGKRGGALDPGVYTISVTTPIAAVQPPAVQATFGKNGEQLRGPLVKTYRDFGGKYVEQRTEFTVADLAPKDFRGLKWGSPPGKNLKRYAGPFHAEKLEIFTPTSTPRPFLGVPVTEESYSFTHRKLYGGGLYIDGVEHFSTVKSELIKLYGPPAFSNDSAGICRWNWNGGKLTLTLSYDSKSRRTSVEYDNKRI